MDLLNTHCCAVYDLAWIEDEKPEDVIAYVYENMYDSYSNAPMGRFLIFVEAWYEGKHYGKALATYIKRNRLGTVTVSAPGKNPGHRSICRAYTWRLSDRAMIAWSKKKGLYGEGKALFA